MYIVAWTTGSLKEEKIIDKWEAYENLSNARRRYETVLGIRDLEIASIAAVVESTDYCTPEQMEKEMSDG